MWIRVANAYGQLFMPLLVWTVLVVLIFALIIPVIRTSRVRLILKTGKGFAIVLALLWTVHVGVLWFVVRRVIQLQSASLHLSPGEDARLWQDVTVACSEMGLVSTLVLIWSSILLLVVFVQSGRTSNT